MSMSGIVTSANVVTGNSKSQREAGRGISVKQIHVSTLSCRVLDLRGLAPAAIQIVRLPCQRHAPAAESLRRERRYSPRIGRRCSGISRSEGVTKNDGKQSDPGSLHAAYLDLKTRLRAEREDYWALTRLFLTASVPGVEATTFLFPGNVAVTCQR